VSSKIAERMHKVKTYEDLPTRQTMKAGHKVRRFRRGNIEENGSRAYLGRKQKPWKSQSTLRSVA
jgi:hypothetical protein